MSKETRKGRSKGLTNKVVAVGAIPSRADFDTVIRLIDAARTRDVASVNTTLIELYWSIGEYISRKIADDGWGQGTVEVLAETIKRRFPTMRGYSARNLWRMMQFFETYRGQPKLSALLAELCWTHNLLILGKSKRAEEREFCLRMACAQKWSSRELERQLDGALFERVVLSPVKVSPPVTQLHPDATSVFKDSYLVEFLDLPPEHSEGDLQRGLVEHLGKLQFYLEALDRDVKMPHEQPSIGVLLTGNVTRSSKVG